MSSSPSPIDAVDGGLPPPRFESQSFASFTTSFVEEGGVSSSYVKRAYDDHEDPQSSGSQLITEAQINSMTPPLEVLPQEEGVALTEWRRENVIQLEEREEREKEILNEIIEEAEEYKAEFYNKWKFRVENNKASNRDKEKLLLENQEKFHAEASKNYWKAAAEMIPSEVPVIEKKGKKKDQENKPAIVATHGRKPGKPTDLSRMRQVFLKLKNKPPPHMNPSRSTPSSSSSSIPEEGGKAGASSFASSAKPKSQATLAPESATAE